jgi:hypothetical protein
MQPVAGMLTTPDGSIIDRLRQYPWQQKVKCEREKYAASSLVNLIAKAVEKNTYRGFRGQKPSIILRPWALRTLEGSLGQEFPALSTQEDYDDWLSRLADDLAQEWKKSTGTLGVGQRFKLINLLVKAVCMSPRLTPAQSDRILVFLHAPLDYFVLAALKRSHGALPRAHKVKLRPPLGMGTVKDMDTYFRIQKAIKWLTDQAEVPRITFDYLTWRPGDGSVHKDP